MDILSGGQGVLQAAQPIFERNLEQAIRMQREFGGPRFSSEAGRQSQQLSNQALQDFNMFSQQVLESGRNRQLEATLGLLGGASQFALGQGQQQLGATIPLAQLLFGSALQAGGASSSPIIEQNQGTFGSIMGGLGTLGGLAIPAFSQGGPFGKPFGSR